MGWLRRMFGGSAAPSDGGFYFYVKCDHCGTPVRVRVNLANDLAADYDDTGAAGYTLTKEVMDDRCFRLMQVTMTFSRQHHEQSRAITGGTFITAEEYAAAQAARTTPNGQERQQ